MKEVEIVQTPKLDLSEDRLAELRDFITREAEDALSSRRPTEQRWRDLMRQKEGVPKNPAKNFPIEGAPNYEITLGAIAADSIYAQASDLIEQTDPFITCRPMVPNGDDPERIAAVKALQRFSNHMAAVELKLDHYGDHALIDDVDLGTGVFYIPWVEETKKTKTGKVISRHPVAYAWPPEDLIMQAGWGGDEQTIPFVALRDYLTAEDIQTMARRNQWNTIGLTPAGARDWVRSRRELLAGHTEGLEAKGHIYEIWYVYCHYDVDHDGEAEDLYVVWDRSSRNILKPAYNPYDTRPIKKFCYQIRPHMAYGVGVLEMISPFEAEMTEIHNTALTNALIANCRMWVGKEGAIEENMKIWPNKLVLTPNPQEDLQALQMGDINASIFHLQTMVTQLAERRVGVNEMSMPRASAVLGTRTPGITALSMLQQVNKRFSPAFKAIRQGFGGAVRHGLYRYQERLLAGDKKAAEHIMQVLGDSDGLLVIDLLKNRNFDESVSVELTVSTAAANREADRQNAMTLVTILGQYYQQVIQLVTLAANPQTPPAVVEVANRVAEAAGEVIDRTIRTFDQIRDPETFVLNVNDAIDQAAADAPQQALMDMFSQLAGGGQQPQQPGQLPAPEQGAPQ